MGKASVTKLGPYVDQLEEWLGAEQLSVAEVRQRLAALGCIVSRAQLVSWWRARRQENLQTELLAQIVSGAAECRALEKEFAHHPAPEMETLLKVHRSLVLKLCTRADAEPELVPRVSQLMRTLLGAARQETLQKQLDLAERKHQDELEARKQAQARADQALHGGEALRPETLEKIERELDLF